jgi:hypothetical protein
VHRKIPNLGCRITNLALNLALTAAQSEFTNERDNGLNFFLDFPSIIHRKTDSANPNNSILESTLNWLDPGPEPPITLLPGSHKTKNSTQSQAILIQAQATTKARQGELSKANELLNRTDSNIADTNSPTTQKMINDVLPKGTLPRPIEESHRPTPFTQDEVRNALRHQRRGTAAGPSRLSPDTLRHIAEGDGAKAITAFINRAFADPTLPIWNRLSQATLVPILKPGGEKIRPIAITEAYTRLIAKIIAFQTTKQAITILKNQYAIGRRGGLEAIIHATRAGTHHQPRGITAKTDFTNAYNSLDRESIRAQLIKHNDQLDPRLTRYFNTLYTREITLTTTGTCSGEASTGVLQGCPLSPLLFALGIDPVIRAATNALPGQGAVMAYLDDVTLQGDPERVMGAIKNMKTAALQVNLELNFAKCDFYTHNPEDHIRTDTLGMNRLPDGIVVLGSPVGSPKFETTECIKSLKGVEQSLTTIRRMQDKQLRLLLIRHCAIPKISHLLRTVPPPHTRDLAHKFDKLIHKEILHLIGTHNPLSDLAKDLSGLPIKLGGLGLDRLQDQGAIRFLASLAEATTTQELYAPIAQGLSMPSLDAIISETRTHVKNLCKPLTPNLEARLTLDGRNNCTKTQERLLDLYHGQQLRRVKESLRTNTSPKAKANLLHIISQAQEGAGEHFTAIPAKHLLSIPSELYDIVIARRLCVDLTTEDEESLPCPICTIPSAKCTTTHLEHCPRTRHATRRHNKVKWLFATLARIAGLNVLVEPTLSSHERPDLRIDFDDGPIYYDVGIIAASQQAYTNKNSPSERPLTAASDYARKKATTYAEQVRQEFDAAFKALIFESTGAYDNCVKTLITTLATYYHRRRGDTPFRGANWSTPSFKIFAKQALSAQVAKETARIIRYGIDRMHSAFQVEGLR